MTSSKQKPKEQVTSSRHNSKQQAICSRYKQETDYFLQNKPIQQIPSSRHKSKQQVASSRNMAVHYFTRDHFTEQGVVELTLKTSIRKAFDMNLSRTPAILPDFLFFFQSLQTNSETMHWLGQVCFIPKSFKFLGILLSFYRTMI
jgi:hypothetical protein